MTKTFFFAILILLAYDSIAQSEWEKIFSQHQLILLGEQAHGVKSFYDKKQDLIREIESESPKQLLLLMESPLVLSIVNKLQNAESNYHYHHTNTEENIAFFNGYDNLGFDLQEDCRYQEFSQFLIAKGYCKPFDADVVRMDSILSLCILGDNFIREVLTQAEMNELKRAIANIKSKVLPQITNENELHLLQLCFNSRLQLADYLHLDIKNKRKQRIQYRDSVMAENAKIIIQHHDNVQVIIWTTNLHAGGKGVMGKKWTAEGVKSMAECLEQDFTLYKIAIDSKRREKDQTLFQKIIVTPDRQSVAQNYLIIPCK